MKRIPLVAALCVIVMVFAPISVLAKPKNEGHGSGHGESSAPPSISSAYEHASEKASFKRDTHDMGKHQGQEGAEIDDKNKLNVKDKGKGKSEADADKGKEKAEAGKGKQKLEADKEKDKDASHISNEKTRHEHNGLLDESLKPKKEKVK